MEDKKLRRRVGQVIQATRELWSEIGEPAPQRRPRWGRGLAAVALGGGGVFLAMNKQARQKALSLLGKKDADTANPSGDITYPSDSEREVDDGGDTP